MKKLLVCMLSAALVTGLAACGGGGGASQPASEQPAQESEATSEEAVSLEDFDFDSLIAEGYQGPTVAAKAPRDLKVSLIPSSAAFSGCTVPCEIITEIGKRYNWTCQVTDGKGVPADQVTAMLDAISWGADVIVLVSIDQSTVQQGLVAAQEAGIPVVSTDNGSDEPNPKFELPAGQVDVPYDVSVEFYQMGYAIGEWVAKDSNGEGHMAFFDCPGNQAVINTMNGLQTALKDNNIEMDDEVTNFTFDQVGESLDRMVTSYVQSYEGDRSKLYLYFPFDASCLSVVEALDNAGFTEVNVCSVHGEPEFSSLIRRGNTSAKSSCAFEIHYQAFATVDQMIRLLNGQDLIVPHNENEPFMVLDATNIPAEGEFWYAPFNYQDAYYALWD